MTNTTSPYTPEQQLVAQCLRETMNSAIARSLIERRPEWETMAAGNAIRNAVIRYSVSMPEELRPGFFVLCECPEEWIAGATEDARAIERVIAKFGHADGSKILMTLVERGEIQDPTITKH